MLRILLTALIIQLASPPLIAQTTLWWDPNPDEEQVVKYNVYRDANEDGTFPKIGEAPHVPVTRVDPETGLTVTVIEFIDTDNIPCFATFSWRVRADNARVGATGSPIGGLSPVSNVVSKLNDTCSPSAPGGLRVVQASGNQALLRWNPDPIAERYGVFAARNNGEFELVATTTDTTYRLKRRGYRIAAVKALVNGRWSDLSETVQLR